MTTREYEALIIFRASTTEPELARTVGQCEEQIKKLGGRIAVSNSMGRRRLAFRIARQSEGYYHLLRFHAPTGQVVALERLLRLNEAIVRFMILTEEALVPLAGASSPGADAALQPAAANANP